jgi:hypothetical protein
MRFFVHYFEKARFGLFMNANSRSDDSLCQSCISQFHSWFHGFQIYLYLLNRSRRRRSLPARVMSEGNSCDCFMDD